MVRGPVECLAAPYRFSYDGDAKVELTGLVSVEKTALLSNEWFGPRGYFMTFGDFEGVARLLAPAAPPVVLLWPCPGVRFMSSTGGRWSRWPPSRSKKNCMCAERITRFSSHMSTLSVVARV